MLSKKSKEHFLISGELYQRRSQQSPGSYKGERVLITLPKTARRTMSRMIQLAMQGLAKRRHIAFTRPGPKYKVKSLLQNISDRVQRRLIINLSLLCFARETSQNSVGGFARWLALTNTFEAAPMVVILDMLCQRHSVDVGWQGSS